MPIPENVTPFLHVSASHRGTSHRGIPSSPSYLYHRGNLYYFRYALPEQLRVRLKRREIRISLQTGYRREAKGRAARLHAELLNLLEGAHMLTYEEIRKRMNGYLRFLLEDEDRDISMRPKIQIAPNLRLTQGQYMSCAAKVIRACCEHNPDALQEQSEYALNRLVEDGVIRREEITEENRLQIVQAHNRMHISMCNIMAAREKGDFLMEQTALSTPYTPIPLTESETATVANGNMPKAGMPLTKAIALYIETKLNDGAWQPHSTPDHKNRLSALVEILGDKDILSVERNDMRHYRETLRKLPPNRTKSKAYRDKTIDEILAMEPEKTLNVATVNIMTDAAKAFFEWCIQEGLMTNNPATKLQLKDERQNIELRDTFTNEELQRIFSHPKFTGGDAFAHPAYFWIPLIGLYTGMRLEEIAQLHCDDIYESDTPGIWVFDINNALGKHLKTKNAKRIIPIHADLVAVGLLQFHAYRRESGHQRLFHELKQTEKTTKLGKQPGKQFKAVIDSLNIPGKKSFHSLRHTFSDFFKKRDLQNDIFRQVFGHESDNLAASQYGSKFSAADCYKKIILQLHYGLNLPKLKRPNS